MLLRVALCFWLLCCVGRAFDFAAHLRQCRLEKKLPLNECLVQILTVMRPYLAQGIPSLGIPKLEPMFFKEIPFKTNEQGIHIDSQFMNIEVSGFSKYSVDYITVEPAALELRLRFVVPELRFDGDYNIDGRIMFMKLQGTGRFFYLLDRVIATGTSKIRLAGQEGNRHLEFYNTDIKFDIGNLEIKLHDLFRNQPILSETVNHFLNENGLEILQRLEPVILKEVNNLIEGIMNSAFSKLPLNAFVGS